MEPGRSKIIGPTELKAEEISQPMTVIVSLFDKQSSEYFKKELWEMLKAVVRDTSWTYLNDPSTALSVEKDLSRLIDALFLMLNTKEQEGIVEMPEASDNGDEQRLIDRRELANIYPILNLYRGRVRRLTLAETENPYLALKVFFEYQSREEWKESLSQWRDFALTNSSILDSYQKWEILEEYEHFEKMIEVAFLFNKENESAYYAEDELYLDELINEFNNRNKTRISKNLFTNLFDLLYVIPPEKFCHTLRKTTLELIQSNLHDLPDNFDAYLADINRLADFLDIASIEIKQES